MPQKTKSKIGILGGTFDPPHLGHLIIAQTAVEDLELDKVLFVPAASPPHKTDRLTAPASHRLAMLRLAIKGNNKFETTALELQRGGISYTVDTLRIFNERYPDAELFLLLGEDNYAEFHSWKSPEEIVRLASLVIYHRIGYGNVQGSRYPVTQLKGPLLELSSTDIRKKVLHGHSIRYFVPKDVGGYIKSKKLYIRQRHYF
jgi:nicotinate-nucleotide adenylyltransferase